MTDPVLQLDQSGFESQVLASQQPVLVDFYADWCQPCRMVAPTIEALATEYEDEALVGKVDVDANPQLAQRYGVSSIPTLLLFHGGDVVERFVGLRQKDELSAAIDRALGRMLS